MSEKLSAMFIFLIIFPFFLFSQDTIGFSGSIKYNYYSYYDSVKDSLHFTNRFNTFFKKTGYEINNRAKGYDMFYVQNDSLILAQFDENAKIPHKYLTQTGIDASIYNNLTGKLTSLNKSAIEKTFDKNLASHWRDSIDISNLYKRDMQSVKKLTKTEYILGHKCHLYKMTFKKGYELFWVTEEIKPHKIQVLPFFFERILFPNGMIFKREAHYKGYVVVTEIQKIERGKVSGLGEALRGFVINNINIEK